MPMVLRKSGLSALTLSLVAGVIWTISATSQVPKPAEPNGYVDSRRCATCHRQIAEDYGKTGMGRSFYRPGSANLVEDFSQNNQFSHPLSGARFSMLRRGNEYFQRRWLVGPDGKEANVEESRIDYIMGSGNHARSYLHRTAANTLIELPLGWYPSASKTGTWGMAPGSDTDHPRTRRFVSYKCMFCHNGIPQIPAANELADSDPVFLGDLPQGIDCQRCHGPGAAHIRAVSTPAGANPAAKLASIRAAIVNPARLSPERAIEVCIQCHLETSSTRIPAAIVRFDRGPFSYKPGEPLGDFMLSFDHAPGTGQSPDFDAKFEAVSSVYRLRKSKCFIQSAGKMTCQTCHNPHTVPRGAAAVTQYSNVCRQCHDAKQTSRAGHPSNPNCLTCHMPKRRAEDIPELVMTDHLITRKLPPGDLLAKLPQPTNAPYHGEVVPYYPDPFPKTGENALYVAVAQVGLKNNIEAGLPQLASQIIEQKPKIPEFYLVLADAWQGLGKHAEAIQAYEQALEIRPDSVRALRSLALSLQEAGKGTQAAAALDKALKLAPNDPEVWYRYGILDAASGRAPAGVDKLRKAIALDPSRPEKSRRLAEALMLTFDRDGAMAALTEALKTDPWDEDAWDLTGRILSQNGKVPEAMYHFERAVTLRPGSAALLFDYALALARAGRFAEARQRAEAALLAQPDFADVHELLGGIFEQERQLPQAAAAYRKTLDLKPLNYRVHLRLGVVLAAQGDRTGAEEHLREATKAREVTVSRPATALLQQLKP